MKRTTTAMLGALVAFSSIAMTGAAEAGPVISVAVSESATVPVNPDASSTSGMLFGTISTANFTGSYNVVGSPVFPQPVLMTNTIDSQSASPTGGTLYVWITERDLTVPQGRATFDSGFTLNNLFNPTQNADFAVVETAYVDLANGLFGGTEMASYTFGSIGSDAQATTFDYGDGTYSETVEFEIIMGAPGGANVSINAEVPEPMTLALLGSGLVGLGIVRRKRAD